MKLSICRYSLQIKPEDSLVMNRDERDTAFIEEVLGLKKNGDWVKLKRVNAHGMNCIAYLEARKENDME